MQNDPELLTVTHGGIQTVPRADFTASPQIVYLDFDGAVTSYVNADLGVAIGGITVEPSGFGDDVTATIAAFLNGMFDDVVFTTELPSDGAFSTIYIGVASAFDEYGDFLGLAETIDSDNRIHDDNAFVLLDSSATAELVVSVIVHETEHIVHGMDHGGEGLARYADIIIKKGQVSSGLTIENDNLTVYSGGTAVGNTVNGGGTLNVDGGGTAVSTTVNEHGELWVFSGGTAVSTTVNYLGYLNVSSGGTAIGTTVNYFGDLNVSSGGTAVGTTLNSRQAHLWVSSGGTAIGTTVNSGGSLAVDRDGTAIGTTVNSGFLFLTGRAFDTTVNLGGQLWVHSGGTITGQTTFKGNAMVYVYSGGKITGRTTFEDWASFFVSGGAIFDFDISDISPFDNALVNNFYIVMGQPFSFTLTVSDWQAKGVYRLADGAGDFDKTVTVVDTLGAELGTLTVGGTLKKGKAEYTLAKSDDSLTVTVDVNTFTGDLDYEKNITDEILASGVNVNEGGILNLLSGGIAVSTTVNDGGNLNVRSGGTAVSTTVNYLGEMTVFDGGTAKETTVNSRGKIFVESGGSVENTTVNSSGWLYVSGGGSVDGTTVNQMGSAIVYADGVASGATVNYEGYLRVDQGGTAHDVVENGGGVFVNDDADATFKPNVFSGLEMTANYTTATVHSGTTANNTTLNGSGVKLEVYNGGTAIDTTVQNGWLEVRGGTAESVAVGSGGSLWLYPDARLTGQMTFEEGAVVIANGAVIDFDISAQSPDNAPLVNDLSLIKGTPSFTITVAESQAEGKYVLAGGTASFDKTLTVFTAEGETLGTITVGDTNVSIGEQVYSLVVSDGQLLFTVGELDTTPPNAPLATASTDKPTNQSVTVTATFSDDSVKKEYSLDNNTWKTYPSKGVKMADNGTVWFRGTDAAGNVSDVTSYKVANIDKVPPAAPTVSADITTPTNGFVTVTPVFSDDSIQRQVSLDGGVEWVGNIEQIVMTANGWVYFRGIDAAGNISETTGYEVTNIDILPPDAPVATASTTAPTNQSVTVTATFSDDSVKKQYSLNNKKWNTYKKGIVLTENCTVWFRSMDEAGNVSEVTSYEVTNIDKEPPAEPSFRMSGDSASREIILSAEWDEEDAKCFYELDGGDLNEYDGPLRFSGDACVHFQTQDAAGNETDRRLELMLAGSPTGVWGDNYFARNCTVEGVALEPLKGRNIIGKVCNGSEDTTILLLTDDGNGDALFLDDIYSAAPDIVTVARLSQVSQIVAGAGDDIIDLTSARFDYANNGITVQGGDGNDVIWANNDSSLLLGDAGDDRIVGGNCTDVLVGGAGNDTLHGGGGGDIFCFGGSWGDDTVEQLEGGSMLLWFDGVEREDLSPLSADADGNAVLSCEAGSVTLLGVKYDDVIDAFNAGGNVLSDSIFLQFGDSGLDEQSKESAEMLRSTGAFNEFSSDRIYDDREMLA